MKIANDTVFNLSKDFMQTSERILVEVKEFKWMCCEIEAILEESKREKEREIVNTYRGSNKIHTYFNCY